MFKPVMHLGYLKVGDRVFYNHDSDNLGKPHKHYKEYSSWADAGFPHPDYPDGYMILAINYETSILLIQNHDNSISESNLLFHPGFFVKAEIDREFTTKLDKELYELETMGYRHG